MAALSPSITTKESGSRDFNYCRKQKSLGLLCTNFLSLYNRDGVETIGLDDAASQLGVERRRIYDIVNVLESVGILAKKAKNRYLWKGFEGIPKALQELKEEGFMENFNTIGRHTYAKVSDNHEDERFSDPNTSKQEDKSNLSFALKYSASSKSDNRKEKSLGLLTQNFVKLFLCSNLDFISLDEAAKILLGDADDPSIMRTKVRRLYDIANVLSSMNFIEKIHHPETRKPSFRWLGMKEKSESVPTRVPTIASVLNESKKRTFGTEITNTSFKRCKKVSQPDGNSNQVVKMMVHEKVKCESLQNEIDKINLELDSRNSLKNYQYGPFAPASKPDTCENNKAKHGHDLESLASTYRPHYHNQALRDLFVHYMEAWKSWYSEVAEKNPSAQLVSKTLFSSCLQVPSHD